MKKILYIIPVLLLTIFLKNNVYGATNLSTVDDIYNHLSTISGMTYVRKIGDNAHNNLKNSDLFISTKNNYNYYIIFGGDVFFFDSVPTLRYFYFANTGPNVIYLRFEFPSNNTKYAKFCFNMDTGAPTTDLTVEYTGSSSNWLNYGPSIGFYTDFFAKDDFYNLFDLNFDLVYKNTGAAVVQKKPEFNFIPTYSENYDTCNLKLNIKNPPNYYTLEYAINSSTSTWYTFDNSTGINIQDNCLVIVRMLDENGDEIFANSFNVNLLNGDFSKYKFKVDFDTPDSEHLIFTPILYNDPYEYFDIVFSLKSVSLNDYHDGAISFSQNGQAFSYKEYINIDSMKVESGSTYYLKKVGAVEFDLEFKIINRQTGTIALTRSFKFKWAGVNKFPNAVSSSTNDNKDTIFNSGVSSNINDNLFASDSLEIDWSMENSKNTIQSFFQSTLSFFNLILSFLVLMPAWITVPLNTLFVLTIVIFVFHVIRG